MVVYQNFDTLSFVLTLLRVPILNCTMTEGTMVYIVLVATDMIVNCVSITSVIKFKYQSTVLIFISPMLNRTNFKSKRFTISI